MKAAHYEGGCLCGAVRYRVEGAPHSAGYCHCRMCQRATGAPVTAWVTYEAAKFAVIEGNLAEYRSSPPSLRGFCARCGSPLTFRYTAGGVATVDVTTASLDEPSYFPPQYHVWSMSEVPWLHLADALPRHAGAGPDLVPE